MASQTFGVISQVDGSALTKFDRMKAKVEQAIDVSVELSELRRKLRK